MYTAKPANGAPNADQPIENRHLIIVAGDHGARAAAAFGLARSPHWHDVAKAHLARQPHCVCCKADDRRTVHVQVHHIFPFHYCVALGRPDLELDDRNLVTLCSADHDHPGENHHLWIGHVDNFQSSNLSVVGDAKTAFHGMNADDIRNDPRWHRRWSRRLKPLDEMTSEDREVFLRTINRRMPRG
jgi:hypothetical protein